MRIFAAVIMMLLSYGGVARAGPDVSCTIPGYLLFGDNLLQRVWASVAKKDALKIVVFGTTSSTLSGTDNNPDAYPARLQATFRRLLPSVAVDVVSYAKPRQTAGKMVKSFEDIVR